MNANNKDASLVVINYDALANKDVEEIRKLVQACESVGMFYLDLGNSRMKDVYKGIPSLLRAGNAFFDLPADCEEKNQSLREGMERGYERRNYSHNGQFPANLLLGRDSVQISCSQNLRILRGKLHLGPRDGASACHHC